MGVAERYNKKQNKDSVARLGVAERYELGLLEDEISSFVTTNNNLFSTAEEDSKYTGYRANSQDWYNNYKTQVDTQKQIAESLKSKLQKYNGYLDKDFISKTNDYITSLDDPFSRITDYAKGQYDYFSEFEDEDAYKEALKGQKTREEMLNFDLDKGKEELDAWEKIFENVNQAERILEIRYGGKAPDQDKVSPKEWEKYLEAKSWVDQYGNAGDVKAEVNKKQTYLTQAKWLQKNADMTNVGNPESDVYDSNFDLYVEKGNALSYGEVGEKKKKRSSGAGKARAVSQTYIDDERAAAMALYEHNGGTLTETYSNIDKYRRLKDEEFDTLAYWMGYDKEHGTNKTEEYLNAIDLTLADREADEIREDAKGLELAFAVVAGLDQFATGIENLFNTEDDYITPSAIQLASGKIREDLAGDEDDFKIFGNSIGQIGYDFITTTSNMAPSILASAAVGTVSKTAGAALGAGLMGASSAGNAYADMVNAGYTKDQARTYSTLVGISEAGLQYALGGIGKLGSGAVSKFTSKTLGGIAKGINKASIQFAVEYGGRYVGGMIGEGIEEGLQEVLDPFFKSLATGEKPEGVDWEQVAYSGMLGALSAGVLEGGGSIATRVSEIGKARAIKNEGNVETLKNVGKTFSADSVAYKIADKVTEKTGAYKLSMLLHDVNANLSEQNVQDIENALIEKHIPQENAKSIAKWLGKAVDGGKLNKAQQMALEDNPIISQVFREVIVDKNSTVNQRLQGMMELNGIEGQVGVDLTAIEESTTKEAISENINTRNTLEDHIKRMAEDTVRKQYGLNEVVNRGRDAMLDGMVNDAVKMANESKKTVEDVINEGNKVSEENGVTVKKIASIGKDGTMMVETDNGDVENADDIQFKSYDKGYIILSTSNMATELNGLGIDLDVASANAVVNGYSPDSGISAIDYMKGAKDTIVYGVIGYKRDAITKDSPYHKLTKSQQDYLYKIGRDIAENTTNKEESKVKARETSTSKKSKNGKVTKAIRSKLKPNQATAISTVEKLSEVGILKNNFYFFESKEGQVNIKGKYKTIGVFTEDVGVYKKGDAAPNGIYRTANGDIYIDINSGANGEGLAIYTLAHELGHYVKHQNPTGFKILADFVSNELGIKLEDLIQDKLDLWAEHGWAGKGFGYMDAYEDVICDALEPMFTDGNLAERLVEKAKSSVEGKGLLKTLKKFFSDLYARIQKAYAKLDPEDPAAVEMKKHQESIGKVADLFADALVEANENFVKSSDIVENAKPISPDEIITDGATVTTENGSKFSLRSIKEDITDGQMFEDLKTYCGWSQERVSNLKAQLESLVEYMTPYRDILDMNETYGREGRRFSPYKPNSDPLYKISLDFSTLCSKRLLTQYVIEQLQLRENRPMSAEEQMAIRDMLKEYGKREKALQVACVMCYVEAARLKSPKQINKWLNDPATQMRNYFADKNPNFSQYIKDAQADFKASKGYSRNATKKDMSAKDVKALNKIRPKLRAEYKPTAEESAIIEQVKFLPNSTYLTAGNLADLSESHPEIYKAYTSFIRTATRSKSLETDEPYYYGDSRRDNGNGIIVSDSFIEAVNRENGMRFSSWSDWRIQHLLDYIVAVIDNSVRGAAMHGYTKFGDEIRVLGKTGMMFNMSGVPGTQNGLNEDGSLSFSDTESINYDEAIALREEFPETAGLQSIGVSKEHIIALLRSSVIDYVIPYHTSGLNATLRRMGDIYGWSDFTNTQHAAEDSSIKKENAIDKEHWHIEPVFSEFFVGYDTNLNGVEAMKQSADNYIRMCKERGLKPKFEEFTSEENYWKLLIDRKMVNQETNTLIQQKAVTPEFDFDAIKGIVDKYVENYDSSLEQKALNHIVENWDSVPKRIRDLKKQGTTKAKSTKKSIDTLANETLSAQPKQENEAQKNTAEYSGDKLSVRRDIVDVNGKEYGSVVELDKTVSKRVLSDPRKFMNYIKRNLVGLEISVTDALGNEEIIEFAKENETTSKNGKRHPVLGELAYTKGDVRKQVVVNAKEVIEESLYDPTFSSTNNDHDWLDKNGWESRKAFVLTQEGFIYEAYLRIAKSRDGRNILYAVNLDINNGIAVDMGATSKRAAVLAAMPTKDSIRNPNGNVKENVENNSDKGSARDIRLNSRNLLANAIESSVTNPTEREWLNKYKAQIDSLNEDQKRLDEINAEIKRISFTKGSDRSKLTALNNNKKTLTARITRADKKLLDFEASKPLKNVLEAEKKRAVRRANDEASKMLKAEREKASKREQEIWEKAKERVQAQKDRASKREQELKDKYTDIIERKKEGRDKTAVRKKIKNVVSYLNSIFNRGTKERNVKLGLQDTVSRALATAEVLFSDEITNADIVRLGVESVTDKEMKYLEEYNNLLDQLDSAKEEDIPSIKAKISRLNSLLKNVFIREKARLNRKTVDYALSSLAEAYKDLKNSPDEYVQNNAFVEGMYDRIIGLKDDLKGVTIKDMSLEQLESVYKIYSMVKHMVTSANSIFRQGKAEDLAANISNVQAEIDAIPSNEKDSPDIIEKIKDPIRSFTWNELKPYYAFDRLGSKTFEKLYWDVVEADGVWAKDMEEAANLIEESRKKHGYKKWDMKTARTFKSSNGLDFKLTLGDMMSIYAYSKRPQAQDHMTIGGFVFDQGSTYKVGDKEKGKGLFKTFRHAKLSETYRVDPKLIGDVIAELEKIEGAKEYVDKMQSYLTQLGEKGNEVSRIMFGIDLFKEKVYFPLQSAKDYRSSIEQTLNATQTMASLKNTGISKETVPHANNPIVLRSFDDVVLEHINTMSKYHAYVIPIENLSKVFNNVGKDTINGDYVSTQALISSKFGNSATKYFDQFITDLNGGSFGGGASNPLAKLFGTSKAVSVAANLSVVVQQYFSVIRALDEINPKYIVPFLNSEASKSEQKQWDELKKYAPIGIIKEIGGFDMGANRSAIDYIGDAETKMDVKKVGKKVKEGTMWLAGKMDEIGWSTIWRAVKKEIADTTDLGVGTEEFFQACGKRFTEVIAKTQVYDSITSRSGYMRSKHESVKYLTSFLGEPTTIVNMMFSKQLRLARAIKSKNKAAIKEATLGLLRGSTVIILSTVLTSLAKSLPYAMRDDEEEEDALLERWAKHFGEATASDMNPLGMIPIGRDLVSIWEGWDIERPDMTLISDIFTSFKRAVDDGCDTDEALALAGSLANILGYPLKNIIRDVKGFIRLYSDVTDDIPPEDIGGAFAEGFTGESPKDNLWKALINNDVDELNKIKKEYKTKSEYESAVRKALKENDPRIKAAAEAKYSGDFDTFKQIVLEIKAEGNFSQDDIISAINSTVSSLKKKNEEDEQEEWYNEESAEAEDEESSIYKASDVNDALERGDTSKAKEIIKDIVDAKVKSGKTEAQAKSSIKTSLASYWKPIYLEASADEKVEIRKMLKSTGVYSGATEIVKLTRKWEKDSD